MQPSRQPSCQAMARHRLGRNEDARQALTLARDTLNRKLPRLDRGQLYDQNWYDLLRCQVLLREAEELIEGKKEGPKQ